MCYINFVYYYYYFCSHRQVSGILCAVYETLVVMHELVTWMLCIAHLLFHERFIIMLVQALYYVQLQATALPLLYTCCYNFLLTNQNEQEYSIHFGVLLLEV